MSEMAPAFEAVRKCPWWALTKRPGDLDARHVPPPADFDRLDKIAR